MQSVTHEENQTQNSLLKIHENSISLSHILSDLVFEWNILVYKKQPHTHPCSKKKRRKLTHVYTQVRIVSFDLFYASGTYILT